MAKAYGSPATAPSPTRLLWPNTPSWPGRRSRQAAAGSWARGSTAKTYEAGIDQRTVLIEFDSVGNDAERDMRIVERIA